jgi:hypothetical protein
MCDGSDGTRKEIRDQEHMAALHPPDFPASSGSFSSVDARRLLLLGGIALILTGMIFGDIFAVFVLHQNAARVGASLAGAAHAALHRNTAATQAYFQSVGVFLESRGTQVDTHVHMIGFGYLALFLAILEPWFAISAETKRRIAWTFLAGAWLLPLGVFLIHYVGLAYSPLQSIGWASIFADFGGLLVVVATFLCLWGLLKYFRAPAFVTQANELLLDRCTASRLLSTGGLLLILLGFAGGAYYATFDLYSHESQDFRELSQMTAAAASDNPEGIDEALKDYGQLQGNKAVKIAAHAHSIEFGLLAMMLSFFQPFVNLRDSWKRRWALTLLTGSLLLPVCVLLELRYGLLAGGLADLGGLLVIVALLAMWIGILRYTGQVDAAGAAAARGTQS